MKKNRVVSQLDKCGCGVACVASVAGLSYIQAKLRLEAHGASQDWEKEGVEPRPMILALADADITVKKRAGLRRWPSGTIVFLSDERGIYKGIGHYMVKTDEGWMDPWFNDPDWKARGEIRERLPYGTGVLFGLVPTGV